MDETIQWEITQPEKFPGRMSGASQSDLVSGSVLAVEAWGEAARTPSSGLTAFAYLWRRFGPPVHGSDSHKNLVAYVLTTPDPEVFLSLRLSGSPLEFAVAYLVTQSVEETQYAPHTAWERQLQDWFISQHPELADSDALANAYWSWRLKPENYAQMAEIAGPPPARTDPAQWRDGSDTQQRVNRALLHSLQELLRPVLIRDVPINILGRITGQDRPLRAEARRSKYAGYGVPLAAMDELVKGGNDERND